MKTRFFTFLGIPGKYDFWRAALWMLWLGMSLGNVSAQDVTVSAEVDPNPAAVDDQVSLVLTVSGNAGSVERPQIPQITGLKLMGGPSTSSQFQWINGQSSASRSFTYIFLPAQEGTLRIPPIKIQVDGKRFQTQELTLQVAKGSQGSRPRPSRSVPSSIFEEDDMFGGRLPTQRNISGDVLVLAEIDKRTVFQGEQLSLTYKLLTQLPVAQVEIKEIPLLKGFWVEELETLKPPVPKKRTFRGKEYIEYTIRKQALFPAQSGNLDISPATFSLAMREETGRFFSFGTTRQVFRKTEPVAVKVDPLPLAGKPADFSGIVGEFKLESLADKSALRVGEVVNWKVTLSGSGNLQAISHFPLPPLPSFKLYSSKSSDAVKRGEDIFQGSKTWEYVLVPQSPGEEQLPEIQFSYFSPSRRQYLSARASPIELEVDKGNLTTASGEASPVIRQEVVKRREDIHFIKLAGGSLPDRSARLYQSAWIYLVAVLPFLLNMALMVHRTRHLVLRRDRETYRGKQAARRAEKQLAEARRALKSGRVEEFHRLLEEALIRYLGEKLSLPQIEIAAARVQATLEQNGADLLGRQLANLLEECHFARYAPVKSEPTQLEKLLEKAWEALLQMERGVPKR
jgi:hypothetical protein